MHYTHALTQRQREYDEALARLSAAVLDPNASMSLQATLAAHGSDYLALSDRLNALQKENVQMKTLALSFAVVAVAVAVIVSLLARGDRPIAKADPQAGACGDARPWTEARGATGQAGTFKGRVVSATYRSASAGKPTFLDMGASYPAKERLSIVIWGDSRSKFPTAPERAYDDAEVAVSGVVGTYRETAQIAVNSPSAIERC